MTRHGKNATASSVYSYHEKKKDTKESGYGSEKIRLGKDSVKDFDCCSLTLQPCRNPVITPDGYLYDKESIFECLLHQKTEIARKTKEFEKQRKRLQAEQSGKLSEEEQAKLDSFVSMEKRILTKPSGAFKATKESTVVDSSQPSTSTVQSSSNNKNLPSFWIPSLTPEAKPTQIKQPDSKTYCPMSKKPLRIKDLIPVKFTVISNDNTPLVAKSGSERYKCAVTGDTLGNCVPSAVLRNTGNVVTMDCVEKLIKKDMLCPFTGATLKEKDIIHMQRGGTGFAGSGVTLEAKKSGPAMQ